MGRVDSFLLWVERKARSLREMRSEVRSQYYWRFYCEVCDKQMVVLRENLPKKIVSGEARFMCNNCGSVMSKPLHQINDVEVGR